MRTLRWVVFTAILAGLVAVSAAGLRALRAASVPAEWAEAARLPRIRPDYAGTVIPPNIAPLNFLVEEPGNAYRVCLRAEKGETIDLAPRGGAVVIPAGPWKRLLAENRGGKVSIDVFVRDQDGWKRFETIENEVAAEEIDRHLVYRLLGASFFLYGKLGIYQRNLETYDERPVLRNSSFHNGCVNCHTFQGNRPGVFSFHARSTAGHAFASGMIGVEGERAFRIVTPSAPPFPAYTSWHPTAPIAAVSVNNQGLFMHGAGVEPREVYDMKSELAWIDAKTGAVLPIPGAADTHRVNTFPAWSADGKALYYSSAPATWNGLTKPPYLDYDKIKYDLMRISYDPERGAWGAPETILTAARTGLSISEPRPSPDGRYLLFCMSQYGAFPVLSASSDLYILELGKDALAGYRPLNSANSPQADSWHSWSSNSRWIVFSSKRDNGLLARPYLCYIDRDGNDHKPFVLPQKDPRFYDTCLKTYNVPELLSDPITVSEEELARAILAVPGEGESNKSEGGSDYTNRD